jgi:hypothetical protein
VILLDTQAAAWAAARPQRLSRPAAEAIRRHSGQRGLAIASVTLMELAQMLASDPGEPGGADDLVRGAPSQAGGFGARGR